MKITDLVPWRGFGRDVTDRLVPVDPMRALQLDVDRAFNHFWRMAPSPFAILDRQQQADAVRVDVTDNGKEITVTAELPGLSDADVGVSIIGGQLTIGGEKKSDREVEKNGVLVSERIYGAFERTIPLPDGVDSNEAQATFKNGVLTIKIPKSADLQTNTRRIPVQAS